VKMRFARDRNLRTSTSSSFNRNSCAASARAARRAHTCSSMRFNKNAKGSSRTIGYSSSMSSSNTGADSTSRKSRETAPRANFRRRIPCCPRRSPMGTSGRAVNARRLRIPQRSNISSQRAESSASEEKLSSKTSTGRLPRRSASRPSEIRVTPGSRGGEHGGVGICGPRRHGFQFHARSATRQLGAPEKGQIVLQARQLKPLYRVYLPLRENDWCNRGDRVCAEASCNSERARNARSPRF
jgi:hypothetical protein